MKRSVAFIGEDDARFVVVVVVVSSQASVELCILSFSLLLPGMRGLSIKIRIHSYLDALLLFKRSALFYASCPELKRKQKS